ncbi:hypothetical protein WJX84_008781 [Apatococcus fuscideae]|uniref:Spermine synthase n=1 Tax=Apatococcus fuscideae TaxID=2026836 RepID=A0AAW1TDJ8_9CHLO
MQYAHHLGPRSDRPNCTWPANRSSVWKRLCAPRLCNLRCADQETCRVLQLPAQRVSTGRTAAKAGLLQSFSEAFGGTEGDPGHWNLSPEWFGSQGGSWGHNTGEDIFREESSLGNGVVTVTSHPASPVSLSPQDVLAEPARGQLSAKALAEARHEWRVLRFNSVTRQSVCRVVTTAGTIPALAVPVCVATEYLKTMLASVAAVMGVHHNQSASGCQQPSLLARALHPSPASAAPSSASCFPAAGSALPSSSSHSSSSRQKPGSKTPAPEQPAPSPGHPSAHDSGTASAEVDANVGRSLQDIPGSAGSVEEPLRPSSRPRVLFIGLGGGTLPLALHHHFPGMDIDAVELDPTVVRAARTAMSFPSDRQGLRVDVEDGAAFVARASAAVEGSSPGMACYYDFALIDTFNGLDSLPDSLFGQGASFLQNLAATLHPEHGTVIANLHGKLPPANNNVLSQIRGQIPGWSNRHRRARQPSVATTVFGHAETFRQSLLPQDDSSGCSYLISVPRQGNSVMVVARGNGTLTCRSDQGRPQPAALSSQAAGLASQLDTAASLVGQAAGIKFQLGHRSHSNLWLL